MYRLTFCHDAASFFWYCTATGKWEDSEMLGYMDYGSIVSKFKKLTMTIYLR